jgi:hypothetical protein
MVDLTSGARSRTRVRRYSHWQTNALGLLLELGRMVTTVASLALTAEPIRRGDNPSSLLPKFGVDFQESTPSKAPLAGYRGHKLIVTWRIRGKFPLYTTTPVCQDIRIGQSCSTSDQSTQAIVKEKLQWKSVFGLA